MNRLTLYIDLMPKQQNRRAVATLGFTDAMCRIWKQSGHPVSLEFLEAMSTMGGAAVGILQQNGVKIPVR